MSPQTMKEQEFQALLKQGEGQRLEFKQHITNLFKIARTITSFANAQGGTILVGVSDDKQITGISPEEEQFMILKAATEFCDPPITPDFYHYESPEGLMVLVVEIKESPNKPLYALSKHKARRLYIREGDQSRIATEEEEHYLKQEALMREQHMGTTNNEMAALLYLEGRNQITVKEYAKLINSSRAKAIRILQKLAGSGYLRQRNRATYLTC